MAETNSFSLLTTMRYDLNEIDTTTSHLHWTPQEQDIATHIWLCSYHIGRLRSAAIEHDWPAAVQFEVGTFLKSCLAASKAAADLFTTSCAFRLRVLLHRTGEVDVTAIPTDCIPFSSLAQTHAPSENAPALDIVIDSLPTRCSVFTRTKTTQREVYNLARERADVPPLGKHRAGAPADVLLYDSEGNLTETSIRNIAFRRGGRWVTPHRNTGCVPGVARQYLLDEVLIDEAPPDQPIRIDEIADGDLVLVSNGFEGCKLGRLRYGQSK